MFEIEKSFTHAIKWAIFDQKCRHASYIFGQKIIQLALLISYLRWTVFTYVAVTGRKRTLFFN